MDRFWQKVNKSGPIVRAEFGPCWAWTGCRDKDGYGFGHSHLTGRQTRVHRVSWELHFGAVPPGQRVLHHCDNPACVRPEHLFLGTHLDNMRDCAAKGRKVATAPFGEAHWCHKLTADQVAEIRRLHVPYGRTLSVRGLAAKFGVSKSTIGDVLTGRNWSRE